MLLVISRINEGTDKTYNMIKDQIEGDGVKLGDWEEIYIQFRQKEKLGEIEVS